MSVSANTGAVVYEGASRFDGRPVVVVLTWQTSNAKTGPMVQAWILRTDVSPADAVRSGEDRTICGDCPRRSGHGCYVNTANAPRAVWAKYTRGEYERLGPRTAARRLTGQRLRIGAYGDPAAVPASLWWALTAHTAGHTGYTHSPEHAPELKGLVMASAETELAADRLQAHGWRTYRVRALDREGNAEPLAKGERVCPASVEGGKKTACAWCLACDGADPDKRQRSIAIIDHSGVALSRLARIRRSRDGEALAS